LVSEGASEARLSAWKDYRSATELAKAWFGPPNAAPPDELLLILAPTIHGRRGDSHRRKSRGIVAVDHFDGEQRNTDLSF
jgi:hypothetical protein